MKTRINIRDNKEFVEEFKPYSTKIREFVSQYDAMDTTNSSISDFDLSPEYNSITKTIDASTAVITDGLITKDNLDTTTYPRKAWKDNLGYQVTEIKIGDNGSGVERLAATVTKPGIGGQQYATTIKISHDFSVS